jgi:hypothetical protein
MAYGPHCMGNGMKSFKLLGVLATNFLYDVFHLGLSEPVGYVCVEESKTPGAEGETSFLGMVFNKLALSHNIVAADEHGNSLQASANPWGRKVWKSPVNSSALVDMAGALAEQGFLLDESSEYLQPMEEDPVGTNEKMERQLSIIRERFGTLQNPKVHPKAVKVTAANHPENLCIAKDATETPFPMPADPFEVGGLGRENN